MAEIKSHAVTNKSLFLGNNEFETGILTVLAGITVPAGAFLSRDKTSQKFSAAVNTEDIEIDVPDGDGGTEAVAIPGVPINYPVAINPVEIKNAAGAPADISFRALIFGKVRADMLSRSADGETFDAPVTERDRDLLRSYGIIAVDVKDISRQDN
jgi:hypothetical protein